MSTDPSTSQAVINGPGRASQACRQCSRLKRKCQRELPICFLCVRLGKNCEYPTRKSFGTTSSNDKQPASPAVSTPPKTLLDVTPFPITFFLDTDLFNSVSHASLRRNTNAVPTEVSELLRPEGNLICERYFNSIDKWFPFVSQKRLNQGIQAWLPTEVPGLSLILLCLKLATDNPQLTNTPANETPIYQMARRYLNFIEETSPVSLYVFQSLVLIALYEIGHAIYPAAYLTVGRAARLGLLMGIHERKNTTQLFKIPQTWVYWEEQRRTWWAVQILERYLNLGPIGLPLATPEPAKGDLLPILDSEWFRGEIGTNQALYTADFPSDSRIGPFARVCQASHVLGRVIGHRNRRKDEMERDFVLDEGGQLNATLTALDTHLSRAMDNPHVDETVNIVDIALCTSARLELFQMYACNQPDATERLAKESTMQTECIAGIKQIIATRGPAIAWHVIQQGIDNLDCSSLLITQCIYVVASECLWLVREDLIEGATSTLELCMEALVLLAKRWGVADEYLQLLKKAKED